jgi:hypothetical protein
MMAFNPGPTLPREPRGSVEAEGDRQLGAVEVHVPGLDQRRPLVGYPQLRPVHIVPSQLQRAGVLVEIMQRKASGVVVHPLAQSLLSIPQLRVTSCAPPLGNWRNAASTAANMKRYVRLCAAV